MKFREAILKSGTKLILGKDEKSNDELMKNFEGKNNIILHTLFPGSPFGVIEKTNPEKKEIEEAGTLVARYSHDWRDNKNDTIVNVFTGKDISKDKGMKPGLWNVKKSRSITIKKEKIEEIK